MLETKQPKELKLLFFTELWERFGFYTVQTILVLYLSKKLLFSDQHAYLLYGTYSALLYLTPAIGGFIADRYLGSQRCILLGGIISIIGYLLCAATNQTIFFFALSLLIIGNGFFKPNVSTIVGELYHENDPRREGGFTIFYMGINIGSLIPPLIAGTIVTYVGWHAGFLLAALGMSLGLLVFCHGRKQLGQRGGVPDHSPLLGERRKLMLFFTVFSILLIIAIIGIDITFRYPKETSIIVSVASVLIILGVMGLTLLELPAQRKRILAALILCLISMGFWALYNQTFDSLMLYADRNMAQHFLSFHIDAEFTQFFNPFFIIAISPLLNKLWIYLAKYNLNPSIPTKFSFGVLFMAAGFIELTLTTKYCGQNGITSSGWLVLSYFLQTIGELLLSPVGLAMITVLSPKKLVGLMMGVWFLSQAGSFAIGGGLATLTSIPKTATAQQSLAIYAHGFTIMSEIAIVLTMVSFLLIPFLGRLIGDRNIAASVH